MQKRFSPFAALIFGGPFNSIAKNAGCNPIVPNLLRRFSPICQTFHKPLYNRDQKCYDAARSEDEAAKETAPYSVEIKNRKQEVRIMLHITLAEEAAAVAASHKSSFKDVWEVAAALLCAVLSISALAGLVSLL